MGLWKNKNRGWLFSSDPAETAKRAQLYDEMALGIYRLSVGY